MLSSIRDSAPGRPLRIAVVRGYSLHAAEPALYTALAVEEGYQWVH